MDICQENNSGRCGVENSSRVRGRGRGRGRGSQSGGDPPLDNRSPNWRPSESDSRQTRPRGRGRGRRKPDQAVYVPRALRGLQGSSPCTEPHKTLDAVPSSQDSGGREDSPKSDISPRNSRKDAETGGIIAKYQFKTSDEPRCLTELEKREVSQDCCSVAPIKIDKQGDKSVADTEQGMETDSEDMARKIGCTSLDAEKPNEGCSKDFEKDQNLDDSAHGQEEEEFQCSEDNSIEAAGKVEECVGLPTAALEDNSMTAACKVEEECVGLLTAGSEDNCMTAVGRVEEECVVLPTASSEVADGVDVTAKDEKMKMSDCEQQKGEYQRLPEAATHDLEGFVELSGVDSKESEGQDRVHTGDESDATSGDNTRLTATEVHEESSSYTKEQPVVAPVVCEVDQSDLQEKVLEDDNRVPQAAEDTHDHTQNETVEKAKKRKTKKADEKESRKKSKTKEEKKKKKEKRKQVDKGDSKGQKGDQSYPGSADKSKDVAGSNRGCKDRGEDSDSWDANFDDEGECLNPDLLAQLHIATGIDKPAVQKSNQDYYNWTPAQAEVDLPEYEHIVEIYGFSKDLKTQDLSMALSSFRDQGFDIKWVDDTHALGVFTSKIAARDAIQLCSSPLLKLRPLSEATQESKVKARQCLDFLLPHKERPKTTKIAANRMISGALGIQSNMTKEERQREREKLKEAREEKQKKRQQKADAWGD